MYQSQPKGWLFFSVNGDKDKINIPTKGNDTNIFL